MGYGWPECPPHTRAQLERFVEACGAGAGEAPANVTLHGSLALGCFNPALSDVDVLVVVGRRPSKGEVEALARAALEVEGIEMSVVRASDLEPFVHPTPYDLHVAGARTAGPGTDPDLAAHVVMGIARGVTLAGRPLRELTSGVRVEDLADSLLRDNAGLREDPTAKPVSGVLNSCRLFRFALEGLLCSKEDGGEWALGVLPAEHREVVEHALEAYRGTRAPEGFDHSAVRAVVEWVGVRLDQLRDARRW